MKGPRIMENKSEIRCAIEELSTAVTAKPGEDDDDDNHINKADTAFVSTDSFLSLCYLILRVLDKIGPTMAVLRQDVSQNIKRLEMVYKSNPSVNSNLVEILKTEVKQGNSKKGPSCSKAFVWLTRSLDLALALMEGVGGDMGKKKMEEVVEECYNHTLKPWHGWISSAAFKVALQLVPDSKTFVDLLKSKDEDYDTLKEGMKELVSLLGPFLQDLHCILQVYNLDKLKSI